MSQLKAHRYRIVAPLARGGLGVIYHALDETSGRAVALKRLRLDSVEERHRQRVAVAFEREYFTLAQIAHPRVIEVYDYGVDDEGPYYTMELLDGTDLREKAPLPWPAACVVLQDVSSSLALLHSRHLLHRDLSPRNVRCTGDGHAKLIDFGAMAPFGPISHVMGTPAYIAPEAIYGQSLDARADLFGLGALAYYALTHAHAYPPTRTVDLADTWRKPPRPLLELVPDLPKPLAQLVASLLSLDPMARPSSAAEVAGRLSAIAGLPARDLRVAHAYLASPAFTGRRELLATWKQLLDGALAGRGTALLALGEAGIGRSRWLATTGLEAKLSGTLSVHVHAAELEAQPYAALRALAFEIMQQRADLALASLGSHAPLLRMHLPELGGSAEPALNSDPTPWAAQVQEAFVSWVLALSEHGGLAIFVDDFERCDAASAALLAELALRADAHPILLTLAVRTERGGALPKVAEAIAERCMKVVLPALAPAETVELLRSVFGDVPHLHAVSEWIQRLGGGNPGVSMELAQHLVERGIARMQDGAWLLPEGLRDIGLPESVEQATEARIAALTKPARRIAQALALLTPLAPLGLAEIVELVRERFARGEIYAALDELSLAQILVSTGDTHSFKDQAIAALLRADLQDEERRALHAAIAAAYLRRDDVEVRFLAAHHLLRSGEAAGAYEIVQSTSRPTELFGLRSIFSRSREGIALHEAMLRYAEEHGLPPAKIYRRRRILCELAPAADPTLERHAEAAIAQLRRDTGLVFLEPGAPASPEATHDAVTRALQRFQSTPETERGLHPLRALQELAMLVIALVGTYTRTYDARGLRRLPGLLQPFLSVRGIAVTHRLAELAIDSIVLGHGVAEQRKAFLQELATPIDGVDTVMQQSARAVVTYYLGLDLALRSDPVALEHAAFVEQFPSYAALAWHVRSIYHACSGDARDMEDCQRRMELFALRDLENEQFLQVGLIYSLIVSISTCDLVTLLRLVEGLDREAARFPGFLPWQRYARAGYHLVRGELELARPEVEAGLALVRAGEHGAWYHLACLRLHVLVELGQHALALSHARQLEATVEAMALRPVEPTLLPLALGLAEGHGGELAGGIARIDRALGEAQRSRHGGPSLALGLLHEARARLARLQGDSAAFGNHAERAATHYRLLRRPGLLARYERLIDRASARPDAPEPSETMARDAVTVSSDPRDS